MPSSSGKSAQSKCTLTHPTQKLNFEPYTIAGKTSYGLVIDPNGSITVHLRPIIDRALGIDIQRPDRSNIDLIKFLVQNLPTILTKDLPLVVTGLTDQLRAQFAACSTALNAIPGFKTLNSTIISMLTGGQTQLLSAFDGLGTMLASQASSGLAQVASGLDMLIDVGLNVQSGDGAMTPAHAGILFTTKLRKTPNQYDADPNGPDPVIAHQTLARALEVNLLPAAPGVTGGIATVALANVPAGPNAVTAAASPTTANPSQSAAPGSTNLPTGVPAGQASTNQGTPELPLALVLLALMFAGGGALAYRKRTRFTH